MKKAVVLLSGGLDSATTLYIAKKKGFTPLCLIFDYGQRHRREIESAKKVAAVCGCNWRVEKITLSWKGSTLLDKDKIIPRQRKNEIPSTYVPARNIIFLSFALSYAEATRSEGVFIGANIQDYSGYPDCRPHFFSAFRKVARSGTRAGVEGEGIKIFTPLLKKKKSEIIRIGRRLGVPFALTWSCYEGKAKPCGRCDSCYFRAKGFKEARIEDPLIK